MERLRFFAGRSLARRGDGLGLFAGRGHKVLARS